MVNADQSFQADVLLSGGLVAAIGRSLAAPAGSRVLNASGLLVLPGGIDPHTHLDMPFMGAVTVDNFRSGHAAALAGGTTCHLDFALPLAHDLRAGFDAWQRKAASGCMDYGLHVAVTSWGEQVAADMATLVAEHGVNSFKFFMAYKGALMVNDAELLAGMARAKALGALTMVHAENGEAVEHGRQATFEAGITGPEGHALSRPASVEDEATGRAIRLAGCVHRHCTVRCSKPGVLTRLSLSMQAGERAAVRGARDDRGRGCSGRNRARSGPACRGRARPVWHCAG